MEKWNMGYFRASKILGAYQVTEWRHGVAKDGEASIVHKVTYFDTESELCEYLNKSYALECTGIKED